MATRTSLGELKAEIARLRKLAYTDELTGLYNRHGFKELSERFMREVRAEKRAEQRSSVIIRDFSIALFDLDRFKAINDTFGHAAGDKVLVAFGALIRSHVREIDVAARWGGEEIVVALVGASESDAARIADKLRADLEAARIMSGRKRVPVTTSCGVACMTPGEDFASLLKRADRALYAAKHSGRNRVERGSALPRAGAR